MTTRAQPVPVAVKPKAPAVVPPVAAIAVTNKTPSAKTTQPAPVAKPNKVTTSNPVVGVAHH